MPDRRLLLFFVFLFGLAAHAQQTLHLSGLWNVKTGTQSEKIVTVPGVAGDPKKMEPVVYFRKVHLPEGKWNRAFLNLNGARFDPSVWINGKRIAEAEGGMAPVSMEIRHPEIKPGKTTDLEIHLKSLSELSETNASRIPEADRWRSNVSSSLWDKIELHTCKDVHIERILPTAPHPDSVAFELIWSSLPGSKPADGLEISGWENYRFKIEPGSQRLKIKVRKPAPVSNWSPENPGLHSFRFRILRKGEILDEKVLNWAPKSFRVSNKKFLLNEKPFQARAVTIVWHRWVRDPEGAALGWDTAWFKQNILFRAKSLGANTIRFHLGTPPEVFLDLCDRYGMAVQLEWLFFHGMKADKKSLENQWHSWLDLAIRHPSVCIIHPWNETEGKELETAWSALNTLLPEYPPLVLAERDVLHLHKYWWSLFENLGLYYDNFEQFPKAVMADEFGGNYLDGHNQPGGYKTLKESFLRFCGPTQSEKDRAELHLLANARVAEYWRRLGVAGFSPFCALGSWDDGNHWFLDSLKYGRPKPVWEGLRAAYSPQSVSLEIWDRNFLPYQEFSCPLHFFNDTPEPRKMKALLCLLDSNGKRIWADTIRQKTGAHGHEQFPVEFMMPNLEGRFILKAILITGNQNPPESSWPIRILKPKRFDARPVQIFTLPEDKELARFAKEFFPAAIQKSKTDPVLVCKAASYQSLSGRAKDSIQKKIREGMHVVFTDAGPQILGAGYPEEGTENAFQASPVVKIPKKADQNFPLGVKIKYTQTAEPESHVHPNSQNQKLWKGLKYDYAWLWNGYRGGLVAPAADMEISGLGSNPLKALWQKRGADTSRIKYGLIAYELQGFYAFSNQKNDATLRKKLKEKVSFLVADAPALQASVNPNAPILEYDLREILKSSEKAEGTQIQVLSVCGKNLVRTPVVQMGFGKGKGNLLISQLLMEGRLAPSFQNQQVYAVRKDPVAIQILINMVESVGAPGVD
jgi:beta-galactosidase